MDQQTQTHIISGIYTCLLYTSDAADERSSVDLGGSRIIKTKQKTTKKNTDTTSMLTRTRYTS